MTDTAQSGPDQLLDLSQLIAGVRWRRRMWMSLAMAGFLLGMALSILLPPPPTGSAQILVVREDEQASRTTSLMVTDIALLQTTRIARATLDRLNLDEAPEKFVKTYEGVALSDNLLEITVEGTDDRDAMARAGALAASYIADHGQRSQAAAEAEARALLDTRDKLAGEIRDASPERAAALGSQVGQLERQADEARIGAPQVVVGTMVVDGPRKATKGFKSTLALRTMVGLFAGLAVGLGLAAIAAVTQDRPVLRRDIAAHLGTSVIAQLAAPLRGPARLPRRGGAEAERRRVAATLARVLRGDPRAVSVLELGCPDTAAALTRDIATELAAEGPVVIVDDLPGRQLIAARDKAVKALPPGPADPDPDATDTAADADADEIETETETEVTYTQLSETADTGPTDAQPTDTGPTDAEPVPVHPVTIVDGAETPSPAAGHARHLGVGTVSPGAAWTDLARLGEETVLVVRAGYADTAWLHTVSRQLADADITVLGVVLVHPDPRDRTDGTLWDELHAVRGRAAQQTHLGQPLIVSTNGNGHPAPEIMEAR